jgi:tetratricopeptide (TPR) repeat protein
MCPEVHIKALVLLSECADYYGQFDESAGFARLGKDTLSTIPTVRLGVARDELNQAKIRLVVAYTRGLYRRCEYETAEKLLDACRQHVMRYIQRPEIFPNYGTLGEIAYTLGRLYRQQQRFDSARKEFNTAINLYSLRGERKRRINTEIARDEEKFLIHKVATIVALGLAWCNYTQGALNAALFGNLAAARMLLRNTGDILNRAYADVVYSSSRRALIGNNAKTLDAVFKIVTNAKRLFHDYEHRTLGI